MVIFITSFMASAYTCSDQRYYDHYDQYNRNYNPRMRNEIHNPRTCNE